MSFSPRRRVQCISVAFGATLLLAIAPLSAHASVSNPTTKSVLKAANKVLRTQSGVHIYTKSTSGSESNTVVVDMGPKYGEETIRAGASFVRIIVTPTNAYLSGTKTGLTTIMGLTVSQEKKVGTLSIVMKAGSTPYKNFRSNLTTSVLPGILPPTKGTKYKVSSDRAKDYVLSWTTPASSTAAATKSVLTISSGSKTLPIKEVITGKTGGGTTTFSKWGEKVVEHAPAAADTIAYAKVIK